MRVTCESDMKKTGERGTRRGKNFEFEFEYQICDTIQNNNILII